MHKSILVLFVTAVFVLSVGYIVVKDRKVIVEQRTASYENEAESEDKNNEIEELSDISKYNEFEEYMKENEQNTKEDKIDLQEENSEKLLGKIIIEKINLVAPVKEGSTEEILNSYVGHIENTATFNGNIGLAAHNRGAKVSYFARLNELKIGDKITYQTNLGTRDYQISSIKEILDTDWSMLENEAENKITLITCINNKINLRLCVQAVEI